MATYIRSLADSSQSTSPTSSLINIYQNGITTLQIFSDEGSITIGATNYPKNIVHTLQITAATFPSGINAVYTPDSTVLSPSVITFGSSTTTQNVVNWTSVPNATSYVVKRSVNADMSSSTTIYTGALLTKTDTGLTAGTTYYYTVTASAVGYTSSTSTVGVKATEGAGRVFVVQGGEGGVALNRALLDGADARWSPLQANDTFKFIGEHLQQVTFRNMETAGGAMVNITANDGLCQWDGYNLSGTKNNLNIDFLNVVSGQKFGMIMEAGDYTGNKVEIDTDLAGGMKLRVRGVSHKNWKDRGYYLSSQEEVYSNGAGKVALELFDLQDVEFTTDEGNTNGANAFALGGFLDATQDKGFVRNLILKRIKLKGGFWQGVANNVENIDVDDVNIENVKGVNHSRILQLWGFGKVNNIIGTGHYGDLIQINPFNRTNSGTKGLFVISNIIAKDGDKYSAVEINKFSFEQSVAGVSVDSDCLCDGITAWNLGMLNTYSSTCVDTFGVGDGDGVYLKNCVAINPYNVTTVINGPSDLSLDSNNFVHADNTVPKINATTFRPASDSPLKGAGVATVVTKDFYNTTRLNPPTVGAVEAS